jgi:hypothetical protein
VNAVNRGVNSVLTQTWLLAAIYSGRLSWQLQLASESALVSVFSLSDDAKNFRGMELARNGVNLSG